MHVCGLPAGQQVGDCANVVVDRACLNCYLGGASSEDWKTDGYPTLQMHAPWNCSLSKVPAAKRVGVCTNYLDFLRKVVLYLPFYDTQVGYLCSNKSSIQIS